MSSIRKKDPKNQWIFAKKTPENNTHNSNCSGDFQCIICFIEEALVSFW